MILITIEKDHRLFCEQTMPPIRGFTGDRFSRWQIEYKPKKHLLAIFQWFLRGKWI
jgi:hypothetical protein